MRFYPHGSGSLPASTVSASFSVYAVSTNFSTTVLSASLAISGSRGLPGPIGACIPVSGSSGSQGPTGDRGDTGTVDGPFTSY
jgi:hypothetical protein